jgi:hypothetical protein
MYAYSPQAKERTGRDFETLQEPLISEHDILNLSYTATYWC